MMVTPLMAILLVGNFICMMALVCAIYRFVIQSLHRTGGDGVAKSHNIWDNLAKKYDRLWVQKYSLAPTRRIVSKIIAGHFGSDRFTLLDLGCGTGQLLSELRESHPSAHLLGVDKSVVMVRRAKKRASGKCIGVFCIDADSGDFSRIVSDGSVDAVVCCHSFPYYQNKKDVLAALHNILAAGGIAVFVQASINNACDRLILRAVEATAEKAQYLSRKAFRSLVKEHFIATAEFSVHERFFMPSICGFILRKRA